MPELPPPGLPPGEPEIDIGDGVFPDPGIWGIGGIPGGICFGGVGGATGGSGCCGTWSPESFPAFPAVTTFCCCSGDMVVFGCAVT
jgi:hypothetical protein